MYYYRWVDFGILICFLTTNLYQYNKQYSVKSTIIYKKFNLNFTQYYNFFVIYKFFEIYLLCISVEE